MDILLKEKGGSLSLKGFKIVGSNPALGNRMDGSTGYTAS